MSILYVVSNQEGAGKTAVCAALARMLSLRDKSPTTLKPLAAGADAASDTDPGIYEKLLGQRQPEGWPLDLAGSELQSGSVEQIAQVVARESEGTDVTLVEASSGLSAEDSRRLAEAMNAQVLLVLRHKRDQNVEGLKRWRDAFGDRLVGSIVNGMSRYAGTETRDSSLPAMESEGLRPLGVVPEDRRLLSVSVGHLAQHLGGRFIVGPDRADALVEHYMVGGLGMDPGELTFELRDNKAVIVRGDRPDVQMSALLTPTTCMVLTNGSEPIEYVKYEAEQEEVAVMVVETDTLTTMDALGPVMAGARFDHPLKLARFAELLEEHVNLEPLWDALGVDRTGSEEPF